MLINSKQELCEFRLQYGKDSEGNFCGINNDPENAALNITLPDGRSADYLSQPGLVFFLPASASFQDLDNSYERCVTACPTVTDLTAAICQYGVVAGSDFTTLKAQYDNGTCTPTVKSRLGTVQFIRIICGI